MIETTKLPFFTKSSSDSSINQNSMYAFSWINQEILPESSVIFIVTYAPDDNIPTPTYIIDHTVYDDDISQWDVVNFNFAITDADYGQNVIVEFDFNGQKETKKFYINPVNKTHYYSKKVLMPQSTKYTLTVVAYDELHRWSSNKITKVIPLVAAPKLTVNRGPKPKYFEGVKITMDNTVNMYAVTGYLKYQFDNGKIEKGPFVGKDYYGYPSNVQLEISFPEPIKLGKHTFYVWAENELGQKSYVYNYPVELRQKNRPNFTEVGLNKRQAHVGESVIGYIVVSDKEAGENLKLYYQIGNSAEQYIETFVADSNDKPYAFFFNIPSGYTGTHDVKFFLTDEDDLLSENLTTTIYINGN